MKFIAKELKNEPETLIKFRKTPNSSYSGFGDTDKLLKKALCKEQGYICCYCMRRISEQSMCVEHYIPQNRHKDSPYSKKIHKENELKYQNMLASCNDKSHSCSGEKKNKPLLKVNPLDKNIENLVSFKSQFFFTDNDKLVEHDLCKVLKLGSDRFENWRSEVLYKVRENLSKNAKPWTASVLKKELENWSKPNKQGEYRPFCRVAIDYLEAKIKQLEK